MATIRGCELAYEWRGAGPDIVWGHGLTASRASDDELGVFDWGAVSRQGRVLRYDARGHGTSASTPDPHDYSWQALADDQLALTAELGIGRYVAGGASMGAATALHAAVLAPHRVAALVLMIPPTAWGTRAEQAGNYRTMADLVEAGRHGELIERAALRPVPGPFVDDPAWPSRFPAMLARTDPVRLARVYRGAATADLPPEPVIATIAAPALILAWTGDPGHPISTAERLHELMPHSELVVASTRADLATWTSRLVGFVRGLAEAG